MKLILLPILLGLPLATPVADTVPKLGIEASCKAAMSADAALGADRDQTFQSCMNDENQAHDELVKTWTSFPAPLRTRCEAEATAGGLPSYVDFLVCMQVANDSTSPSSASSATPSPKVTSLKGASKRHR
jgi:hypothetical protein